ncbi:hypothetical protein PPTG_21654 [Phytophthora nicotianae INRA-310]|uniref:Uncharacterized protein n=2 Tax=Phytophthora nicotianae TaxID=4792 RepID=W2QX01_PHYN3|nr:hypothetical protein PPTG_21654 [Phytophthora nicotianae INRA-310]ETN17461.1 hypothetical protein PPTG_21654 [Phytophthora nicotianae INRA-310]
MGAQMSGIYGGLGAGHQEEGTPFNTPKEQPVAHVCKDLGSGFEQWDLLFVEQIEMAEYACGYSWPKRDKVNKFVQYLCELAELFYQQHVMCWWVTQLTPGFEMEPIHMSFKKKRNKIRCESSYRPE